MSPSYAKSRPIDIAGFNFDTQQTSGGQASGSPTPGTQGTAVSGNPLPFDYRRPEASERMANDKLGEELAPDATIWKLYLEEAAEYDRELVEGQHKSLDMLLLFAALFSAILTAFLIESKELLQQNPQDATFALQLLMAQSQYRMEHGLPPPESDNVPSAPQFSVSGLARSINGLWFTSLGLSLSAALIAMLGKEWLTAFLASRPRAAHPHALLRQARLQGLERWWALHIIAFLPSLLHASLLLFSVGLVIYLWILDHAIAAVLASVVAMTTLFYVVTAVLGAIYDYCPFVTELSKYVRQGVVALIRPKSFNKKNGDKSPSYEDLQALLWLFNNARDPAVVECSYQALSGLNTSSQALDFDITNGIIDQASLEKFDIWSKLSIPVQVDDNTTVTSLLRSIIDRFQRAIVDPQILLSSHQSSLPRLLNAIVALACHTYRPYLELTGDISTKDALEMRRLGVASDEVRKKLRF
ncbi:hypothetical protein FRC07_011182 [Ceratobasidium sp. 392]|nr:hypothetical protein FRC07_011182 [Ceratobasidium sp. 392]